MQTLMKRFCPRGKYIPAPAYWHQPGAKAEDVGVFILKPEDIPHVELDGAVFEVLVQDPHASRPKAAAPALAAAQKSADTIAKMQSQIDQLTGSVQSLVQALGANQQPLAQVGQPLAPQPPVVIESKRGPGRPKKQD